MLAFLFLGFFAHAEDLPKTGLGRYGGEMPGYTVEINGNSVRMDEHDVFITIRSGEVIYVGGNLELSGAYTVYKQNKNEYLIKTKLTNGKSMHYEIDFIWRKKEREVYITPKNGQSGAVLEYLGD